ncbi:protein sel-1 homolog 1 [Zeugodacus cucurbitae]|uniref:protein sel-1 homolog 1 n=1 Tax=Zeugodacus cucurbitae TaxID=28588 RepID=UPI0023D9677A|nr:protein sel-1 homolog 1 [Zeugodacus cucurbitae]
MRARFKSLIVLFLLPLLILSLVTAELQGPLSTQNANLQESAPQETTTTSSPEKTTGKVANTEETTDTHTVSNERKSSKYVAENESPTDAPVVAQVTQGNTVVSLTVDNDIGPRFKIWQQALFEQQLNEKLVRQKLEDQIATIENTRKKPVAEPTPREIEAQTFYEKAMDLFAKPPKHQDKYLAYKFIARAAEMNHLKARAEMAWAHLLGRYAQLNYELAATEFDELAKEGVPEAHMGLAFLYSIGVGGKNVSQPLTLIHLTLAALGEHTFAQMALGYRYLYGINVPTNCEKALMYYKKVAKKVASKITFSNGPIVHRVRLLDESENPGSQETEIVDYYQLLADKGDVQSQVGLGQLYYQGGKAIQQDHQKALEYFTKAANTGNAIGFAFLGKLYLEGSEFIKADNETAFKYFKKAAELGDPVGQSGLGLMYLKGLGVPKDPLKALNYFTQAADQGWVDGQLQLGNMYFTGNGVKTDYKLALKYFNLASQSGHVLAYYNLGIMHTYGIGMLRSCPAAVEFFKNVAERGRWSTKMMEAYSDYKDSLFNDAYMQYALLAELGYEVAQSNAAFLLDRGDGTIFHDRHEELIRAFYYWKRAAGQGYSAAQVKLGDYYYYGWGTNVDFETAASLYRKASDQQYNAQAMFNLGYMHEQGLGMKKDWHLAKRLYDLAAETNADAKVPVAIALLKLQMLAKVEAIKQSPYKFIFYMDENIAANWDLYMITILTLLLGFIMYTRRPYQDQQPADQQQQLQPEQANPEEEQQQQPQQPE